MIEVNWYTTYITVQSAPDTFGRVSFCAQWMDDCIGRKRDETGLRGQMFRCNLEEFINNFIAKGWDVEYCDHILERDEIVFPPVPDERGKRIHIPVRELQPEDLHK